MLADRWDPARAVQDIRRQGVTYSGGAEVFIRELVDAVEAAGLDSLPLASGYNCGGSAIPSDLVRDVYAQLKKYGRVRRGEIGVVVRSVTPTIAGALGLSRHDGVLIQDVQPEGTALAAGLKADDIVNFKPPKISQN